MDAFTRGLFGELGREVRIRFSKTLQEAVTLAIAMRDVERRPTDDRDNYQKGRSFEKNVFAVQTPVETNAPVTRPPQRNQNFV